MIHAFFLELLSSVLLDGWTVQSVRRKSRLKEDVVWQD